MRFPLFSRSSRARTADGAVSSVTPVASQFAFRNKRAARAILPAVIGLGALSLGILGLRAQNSAPPTIAVSRHALNNNGRIEGSAQQLLGENLNLNGGTFFGGDLLVPGTPRVKINGKPDWDGQRNGGGSNSPSNYQVSINSSASLGYLDTQSDPIALDFVATPPNPRGTRGVNINNARDVATIGAWSSVRDLNLNGSVDVAVPAGTYGGFNVNGGALVLGTQGDTAPDVYNFQSLNFNGQSQLKVVGPIVVTVRNGLNVNSVLGSSQNQSWLRLNISAGGLNLNNGATIYGAVRAPNGSVNINGTLWGSVQADRLNVNNGGVIKLGAIVEPTPIPTPLPTATPIPTATPKPIPTPTGAPLATVMPIVECVESLGGGQYRAHFGTSVPGAQAQIIPVGSTTGNENKFSPNPIDRDQPTSFLPGRTVDSFQVVFNGSNLTWTLRGRAVTVSANSNGCPVPTPTPTLAPTATPIPLPTATPLPAPTATPVPNQAPVGVDDAQFVKRNGSVNFELLGVDNEGDALTYRIISGPKNGVATPVAGAKNTFNYAPNRNFVGDDFLQFVANDGKSDSDPATVLFVVQASNEAPVGVADAYATDEDTVLNVAASGVLSNDTDADGDALSAVLVSAPAHGTLNLNANGGFVYAPNLDYNGSDSFTYRASDGALQSEPVTVSIAISPVNDAPVAVDGDYTIEQSETLSAPLNGTDVDDPIYTLHYVLVTAPTKGTLEMGRNSFFAYAPNPGALGADTFTFRAVDPHGAVSANIATQTLNIVRPPHAPTARADAFTVVNNGSLDGNVLGNDSSPVNAVLTAVLETGVAHGKLTLNANGSFTYQPSYDANGELYVGADGFTYHAQDPSGATSLPATVAISVTQRNRAPISIDDNYSMDEDGQLAVAALGVLANDTDEDGDVLRAFRDDSPQHGVLSLAGDGSFIYTPQPDFNGQDSFTYEASDGKERSRAATVTITVRPVNDAPVAIDEDRGEIQRDAVTSGTLRATDIDDDAATLTFALVDAPAHGDVTISANGTYNYRVTPGTLYAGADSFSFRARDAGGLNSNVARVKFTVAAMASALVARDDEYGATDGDGANVSGRNVLQNDSGVGPLTAVLVSTTTKGTLTFNADGSFTYVSTDQRVGEDRFTYRAVDARGATSNLATATIVTTHVNHGIYANVDTYSVGASGVLRVGAPGVLGNDTDVDIYNYGDKYGDKLTAALAPDSGPRFGAVVLRPDGSFDYTLNLPLATQETSDSFYYVVSDGLGQQATGRVAIRFQLNNNAPVAQPQSLAVQSSDVLPITLSGTDADGDAIFYEIVTLPEKGQLLARNGYEQLIGRISSPLVSYQPTALGADPGATDSFTFRVRDARGAYSDPATISIRRGAAGGVPVAVADEATTTGGAISINVLSNDSDPNGEPLRVISVRSGDNGQTLTISADGQSVTYKPGPSFYPPYDDSFVYTVANASGATASARVTVHQVQYGGVDGTIISYSNPSGYMGLNVTNRDGSGQIASGSTVNSSNYPGAAAYSLALRNIGPSPDSFVLRGPAREPGASAANAHWSARYFAGDSSSSADVEITAAVTSAAGWTSPQTDNGGATRKVRVEVRADASVANGASITTLFDIHSARDDNARDVVGATSTKGAATAGG